MGVVSQAASLSSLRGSGYQAPGMVMEVFPDLFWEGLALVFQPQVVVEHEFPVGVDEDVRIGVDPAEIFAGKSGGSWYVGDVDEARDGLLTGCGQADDTAAIGPANRSHRRIRGSYGVTNFVAVLGKAGCRRAVGGQIWRDHLDVCVFE